MDGTGGGKTAQLMGCRFGANSLGCSGVGRLALVVGLLTPFLETEAIVFVWQEAT